GVFRVPLDADRVRQVRIFDDFDEVVGRAPAGGPEPTGVGDALVVEGVDGQLVAEDRLGAGAGHQAYGVLAELRSADRPVVVVAEYVGQVLVQLAAVRHRHQLHATADAQDRQAGGDRRAEEQHLGLVAYGLDPGGRVWRGAVEGRVNVGTPGEHDPVE